MSSTYLFPGADATTKRLVGSSNIISATFLNWFASASELPPNFTTFVSFLYNPPPNLSFIILQFNSKITYS